MRKTYTVLLFLVVYSVFGQQNGYIVQEKETLYTLSKRFDLSIDVIKKANPFIVNDIIKMGDTLHLPIKQVEAKPKASAVLDVQLPYHIVEDGQTLYSISKLYNTISLKQLKEWNKLDNNNIDIGSKLWLSDPHRVDTKKKRHTTSLKSTQKIQDIFQSDFVRQRSQASFYVRKVKGLASAIKTSEKNKEDYYILYDGAPVGSVVEVVHLINAKHLYFKVVGPLPKVDKDKGVILKMSHHAAKELKAFDSRFLILVDVIKK